MHMNLICLKKVCTKFTTYIYVLFIYINFAFFNLNRIVLYSLCHRHWIVSLVIIGIVYAHVQFTLCNFNTLVLLIGGH